MNTASVSQAQLLLQYLFALELLGPEIASSTDLRSAPASDEYRRDEKTQRATE